LIPQYGPIPLELFGVGALVCTEHRVPNAQSSCQLQAEETRIRLAVLGLDCSAGFFCFRIPAVALAGVLDKFKIVFDAQIRADCLCPNYALEHVETRTLKEKEHPQVVQYARRAGSSPVPGTRFFFAKLISFDSLLPEGFGSSSCERDAAGFSAPAAPAANRRKSERRLPPAS